MQINEQGYYQHNKRTAIFVGDFIDRGDQQKAVINIVRRKRRHHKDV